MRWIFLIFLASLQAGDMGAFLSLHVPMREGKIAVPQEIEHVKLDIGLSYSAPMSQQWLSQENRLIVFGFEPNPSSVNQIRRGAVKLDESHSVPLNVGYVDKSFFLVPCALGLSTHQDVTFYVTKNDPGCSSLYRPIHFPIEQVIQVPLFSLSDFFDLFPFDTHPVIDYIKIDAQGSDLDIVKSGGNYLAERVVYITIEAENDRYKGTSNSDEEIERYMKGIGFVRHVSKDTEDPTYLNPRFADYAKEKGIKIFQKG